MIRGYQGGTLGEGTLTPTTFTHKGNTYSIGSIREVLATPVRINLNFDGSSTYTLPTEELIDSWTFEIGDNSLRLQDRTSYSSSGGVRWDDHGFSLTVGDISVELIEDTCDD